MRIFENLVGQDGGWVQLQLEGNDSNRMGLGARVTLETPDGSIYRYVDGGHGHFGMQNEATLTLGVGAVCSSKATIPWPDGSEDTSEVHPHKRYRWVQGERPTEVEQPIAPGIFFECYGRDPQSPQSVPTSHNDDVDPVLPSSQAPSFM